MVKTKIRRSLFVGLGGTGMRTLLYLKKLFVDTYGEVPPMIGFLGVDTDMNEFTNTLEAKSTVGVGVMNQTIGDTILYVKGQGLDQPVIKLDPSEQLQITVDHPRDIYNVRKDSFKWLPKSNLNALRSLRQGAGMVRTNGRFALVANSKSVESKVKQALSNVASITAVDNDKYELIDTKTDVYLIFSLGGGTGCGTFLDMAYLIRRCDKNCKIAAYALLPKVFKTKFKNAMDRVMPNGYGAVEDLDWLMCRDWSKGSIDIPIQDGRVWQTNDVPFDVCMLIDNENNNHDVYSDNRQLEEMIALSLVTSVGELSKANTSVLDNIAVSLAGGAYDVEHKKAWVSGMGVCEAIVNTDDLRKIYAHNVAINLANQLLTKPDNVDVMVMQWIDSPEVKIREHNADDVIDFLLKSEFPHLPEIDKDDYKDAINVAKQYISSQLPADGDIDARLQTLISRIADELRKFVVRVINRREGAGVGATELALKTLQSQVQLYLKEMKQEKAKLEEDAPQYESMLESVAKQLKGTASSAFAIFKTDTLKNFAENLGNIATEIARIKRDIIRHDKAITFFNDLLTKIGAYQGQIKEIDTRLKKAVDSSVDSKTKIRTLSSKQTETFQYNLTSRVLNQAELNGEQILFSDFLDNLRGNQIWDFSSMDTPSVWQCLVQYGYNLPKGKELGEMNINDIIAPDHMSEGEFSEIVRKMVAKSSPLLPHDYHGYRTGSPEINYYIGVKNYNNNRLFRDDYFKKNISGAADVNFSNIGMSDRMIIFSQMAPIPPFAISSIDECRAEYEDPQQTINFHFDAQIYDQMKRQGYSLSPGDCSDNALDLWVRGFIFGLIDNTNGAYRYYDRVNGRPLCKYWVELDKDRDVSFAKFKDILPTVASQFEKKFAEIEAENGTPYVKKLLSDAKENYFDKYSRIGIPRNNLVADNHLKGIADQIESEMSYLDSLDI